ncbi:MAG: T9SS type A sorting domain-containing protein, partial [Crocinitomicaceae bacterium]|nr:T9SS type A sorting domain-containing protein [Crocinitomicaceae bacterium]
QKVTGSSANGQANGRFWYVASPTSAATSSAFDAAGANIVKHYNENTFSWSEINDNNTPLVVGKGYYVRPTATTTLNFTGGQLNNGSYTSNLTRTGTTNSFRGYNLVSNPYPSYLDWNGVNRTNVATTMWYRTANQAGTAVFDTYNADAGIGTNVNQQGAVTRYIPPMQSYWVFVTTNNPTGSISYDNQQRSHFQSGIQGLKSTAQDFPMFLRLNVHQGSFSDQIVVFMKPEASSNFDVFDSEKMFLSGVPQLYTKVSNKKLVINGMKNNKKHVRIPLVLDIPSAGYYHFSAEEFNTEDGLILLEDVQEGVVQDLTQNQTYAFFINTAGTIQDRFFLIYNQPNVLIGAQGPSSSWVEAESTSNEGGQILVSSNGRGEVMVSQDFDLTEKSIGTIQITDATGKTVYDVTFSGASYKTQLEGLTAGIYFVKVEIEGKTEIKKIFVQP